MAPAIFGFSIAQISTVVDRLLASFLPEGSISFLYYANRLLQFPLGVFGIALTIAIFPALSAHAARKEEDALLDTLREGLRLVMFVCLPSAVGLAILASPIIQVLFERGAFTATDTDMTARAVIAYSGGLVAYAGVKIVVSAFYSLQDTRTPVKIAAFVLLANVVLNLILMIPLKHAGLALASALCAFLNVGLLLRFLRKRLGPLGGRVVLRSFTRILPPTILMAVVVFATSRLMYDPAGPMAGKASVLGVSLLLGALVYLLSAKVMGCPELSTLRESLRRQKTKEPPPMDFSST
jgi:putative peptidoglycan lipid II flippase